MENRDIKLANWRYLIVDDHIIYEYPEFQLPLQSEIKRIFKILAF